MIRYPRWHGKKTYYEMKRKWIKNMSEFDLLHWPNVVNAVLVKALGKKAVFTIKELTEYKVQSGKNIGEILPVLILEHESGNQTRLSLKTEEHRIRLNKFGITGSKKAIGCRIVMHIEKCMSFGKEVDCARIDTVLGKDSIEIPESNTEEDPDEPTADELLDLYSTMDE